MGLVYTLAGGVAAGCRLTDGGIEEAADIVSLVGGGALAGVHQELDVAGRAGQRGNHGPHDAGSGVTEGGRDPFEGAPPHLGIPYHPLAAGHDDPAGLELRLHQEHQIGPGASRSTRRAPASP